MDRLKKVAGSRICTTSKRIVLVSAMCMVNADDAFSVVL